MIARADYYAQLNVPRYTSYPTAASFANDVSAAEQQAWLQALPPRGSISIYLHVPYCREICYYCGCNTKAARRTDVVAQYRAALESEIDRAGYLVAQPAKVSRIHWGGGTPSILGTDGLGSVLSVLRRHFDLSDLREHAIELDPRFVTRDLASGLVALGVTRVSLGIQDIDPNVQVAIGRIQPLSVVQQAVAHLRAAGLQQINFDLIYGLPGQSVASLRATCDAVAELSPNRIAYFGYAHVPNMRANQRLIDSAKLPQTEDRLAQIRTLCEAMERNGYVKIGIDHFARGDDPLAQAGRAGKLRRNFQGYTDDSETVLLGFGASSISRFPQGYLQNISDPLRYVAAIENGLLPAARGIRLSERDWTRARIIEALMCDFRVDLASVAPGEIFADELEMLKPLARDGLVRISGNVVSATDGGRALIRVVAAVFDESLPLFSRPAFSRAV